MIRNPCFGKLAIVALLGLVADASNGAVYRIELKVRSQLGDPIPAICVRVSAGESHFGVHLNDSGEASVDIPIPEGVETLTAHFYRAGGQLMWLGQEAADDPPTCPLPKLEPQSAWRKAYTAKLGPVSSPVVLVLEPVSVVSVIGRVVDGQGKAVLVEGCSVSGVVCAGKGKPDGTFRLTGVPKNESAVVTLSIDGEIVYVKVPPLTDDMDLGEIVFAGAARVSPVEVGQSFEGALLTPQPPTSVTFVSTDGSRAYGFVRTARGLLPGPRRGDAVLVAAGEYFVLPASGSDAEVVDLVFALRSGRRVSGVDALPRVLAAEGANARIEMSVGGAQRAIQSLKHDQASDQ